MHHRNPHSSQSHRSNRQRAGLHTQGNRKKRKGKGEGKVTSHQFSSHDFGLVETYFLDRKNRLSTPTTWDGPDLVDPQTRVDDVFRHAFQLLGVNEVEWLEFRFEVFDIGTGKLLSESERTAYTDSWFRDMVF